MFGFVKLILISAMFFGCVNSLDVFQWTIKNVK